MQQAGELEIDEEVAAGRAGRRCAGGATTRLDAACAATLQATGLLVRRWAKERYRLLHQMVQEYGAAAYLAGLDECGDRLPVLAQRGVVA